jgi:hypothetical protein
MTFTTNEDGQLEMTGNGGAELLKDMKPLTPLGGESKNKYWSPDSPYSTNCGDADCESTKKKHFHFHSKLKTKEEQDYKQDLELISKFPKTVHSLLTSLLSENNMEPSYSSSSSSSSSSSDTRPLKRAKKVKNIKIEVPSDTDSDSLSPQTSPPRPKPCSPGSPPCRRLSKEEKNAYRRRSRSEKKARQEAKEEAEGKPPKEKKARTLSSGMRLWADCTREVISQHKGDPAYKPPFAKGSKAYEEIKALQMKKKAT